ncbi:sulfur carrier protein ThiS [Geomonas sp. RF6]|uniref:sulfur carrier protein ThiS n=1 Tax=Geomonas sp. RF6 TaxID=2897342 RepID=UPI001E3A2F5B|nr:sulfur carrier protein ThiS [Geomonas sp. RF6]UFS71536.1 sulfur carrier protein ThiS [Geomonas sp. RF6]
MKITVNGEAVTIDPISVQDYLLSLQIDPVRVAVELNREILPKADYQGTLLQDGDVLEIVHFVGGGEYPAGRGDNGDRQMIREKR